MAENMPERMTEDELAKLCTQEYETARSYMNLIQQEREDGLNSYNTELYGNEEAGLSKFVSSDVRDAVEWTLPQLCDMFVGGTTPVMFEGEGAADVAAAQNESRYIQYVFERQNPGVILAYTWFKDALLEKNGLVKAYWEDKTTQEREEYKEKNGIDYQALAQDDEFEIMEVTVEINEVEYSEDEYAQVLAALASDPQAQAACENDAKYHIIGYRKRTVGQARIVNVAPENFVVHKDHPSVLLEDCTYCCEVMTVTRSDLIAQGYDKEMVYALPASNDSIYLNEEKTNRMKKEGGSTVGISEFTSLDPSRQNLTIYRHLIRADYNNDGQAELLCVVTCGSTGEYVLDNSEIDAVDYFALTPYLNSYKFYGRSMADNLVALQKAKSQLWRNSFDNFMYSAMPRKLVQGNVNIQDLMTFVPGGIVRMTAGSSVTNDTVPFVAGDAFPMLDRMDDIRSERSGFSRQAMGLDPSALANSTNQVGVMTLQQSQLLVKMIATVFAYSGFQKLMLHLRALVMKNEKGEKIFDLTGEELKTDPRDWRKQRRTTIQVGVGYAGRQEQLALAQIVLDMQQKMVAAQDGISGPLVQPQGVFAAVSRLLFLSGIKDAETYFQNPAKYTPPPPPPPSLAAVQTKAQIDKMNADVQERTDAHTISVLKEKNDHQYKMASLAQEERLKVMEIEANTEIALENLLYQYGKTAEDNSAKVLENLATIIDATDPINAAVEATEETPEITQQGADDANG